MFLIVINEDAKGRFSKFVIKYWILDYEYYLRTLFKGLAQVWRNYFTREYQEKNFHKVVYGFIY